jgi:hypothetical protein
VRMAASSDSASLRTANVVVMPIAGEDPANGEFPTSTYVRVREAVTSRRGRWRFGDGEWVGIHPLSACEG